MTAMGVRDRPVLRSTESRSSTPQRCPWRVGLGEVVIERDCAARDADRHAFRYGVAQNMVVPSVPSDTWPEAYWLPSSVAAATS